MATYGASDTYINGYGGFEAERAQGVATKVKWFIPGHFENIFKYFLYTDRRDAIQDLKERRKEDVSVEKWSPFKLEAYHSLHIEKALRVRYSGYDQNGIRNSSSSYGAASGESKGRAAQIAAFANIERWSTAK